MTMTGKEKRYLSLCYDLLLLTMVTFSFQVSRFDDDVDDHLADIEMKYAAGNCEIHHDKECFHHRPTDNHFELMHARKIFWAVKIVSSFQFEEFQCIYNYLA